MGRHAIVSLEISNSPTLAQGWPAGRRESPTDGKGEGRRRTPARHRHQPTTEPWLCACDARGTEGRCSPAPPPSRPTLVTPRRGREVPQPPRDGDLPDEDRDVKALSVTSLPL